MGLSDGRKSFPIGLAVLIQYRSVTASHPGSHVAVAITLNAKASSLKTGVFYYITGTPAPPAGADGNVFYSIGTLTLTLALDLTISEDIIAGAGVPVE